MAYNRPDPQVHHWFIPRTYLQHAVNLMLTSVFSLFAIFFMQLWGKFPAASRNVSNQILAPIWTGSYRDRLPPSNTTDSWRRQCAYTFPLTIHLLRDY